MHVTRPHLLQLGLQSGDVPHGAAQEHEYDPEGAIPAQLRDGAEEGPSLRLDGRGGAGRRRRRRQRRVNAAHGEKEAGEGGQEPDQVQEGDVVGSRDEKGGEGLAQHKAQRVGHTQDEGGDGSFGLAEPVLAHLWVESER
jgi:hypothetical protein